jgi:hypothetical protein
MKTVIKTSIRGPFLRLYIAFTAIALGLLPLAPGTQAVSPPPDGGYPGQNTAEGQSAFLHLAGGTYNTAVGWASLGFNVTGNFNTAVGAATLLNNTADNNTATGAGGLLSNTTGSKNTANGTFALYSNIAGGFNTATGFQALKDSTGDNNTATGADALLFNTIGNDNTATGENALRNNTTGVANTATGQHALMANISGNANTATGQQALLANTNGTGNTATGQQALLANTSGTSNAAVGDLALLSNRTGNSNTAVGSGALESNTTGSGNIALGYLAGFNVTTANNVICIGADGNNVDNSCYIGNIFGSTSSNGVAVLVNSNGRLGTMTSSARFKDEIKPMDKASEAILALRPVSFRYKKEIDLARTSQFGLVAEEVEKVNRDLVVRDKEGKAYSVRYDQVNAMLLNEFLKEHRTVQELKNEVAALTATVKEQAAQIQKVSARLEVGERRSRTVLNSPQNDRAQ